MILAIIATFIFSHLFINDNETFIYIANEISLNLIGAMVGVLGFIIGGMAILTGTINSNIIKNVNNDDKFEPLMSIMYSFYYTGALIGVNIFLLFTVYLITYLNINSHLIVIIIIGFIVSFLFCFSIIYSIALLGTCLQIMLIGYKYSTEADEKDKRDETDGKK